MDGAAAPSTRSTRAWADLARQSSSAWASRRVEHDQLSHRRGVCLTTTDGTLSVPERTPRPVESCRSDHQAATNARPNLAWAEGRPTRQSPPTHRAGQPVRRTPCCMVRSTNQPVAGHSRGHHTRRRGKPQIRSNPHIASLDAISNCFRKGRVLPHRGSWSARAFRAILCSGCKRAH